MKRKKILLTAVSSLVVLTVAFLVLQVFDDNGFLGNDSRERSTGDDIEQSLQYGKRDAPAVESLHQAGPESVGDRADFKLNRDTIEPEVSLGKPLWRVLTWFNKPCIGTKVVATEVSSELVAYWLDLYEKSEEPNPVIFETETSLDGSFTFPELEAKIYCVRAEAEGYGSNHALLDLRNGWIDEFNIEVRREKSIIGAVYDCSRKPVEGVEVICFRSILSDITQAPLDLACDILVFSPTTITDAKGDFRFEGLPVAAFELYAEPEGFIPVEKKVSVYDCDFQAVYLKKPCVLQGLIADRAGNPVESASITYRFPQGGLLLGGPVFSDKEGKYQVIDAPEGGIILQAVNEEYGNTACRVNIKSDAENEQDLVLPGGVKVALTVTDEKGEALDGVRVTIEDWTTGAFLGCWFTDEKGFISISGINLGTQVRLRLKKSGYFSQYSALHTFLESGPLTIELQRRTLTHLKVFDAETAETIIKYHVCICPFPTSSGVREKFSLQRGIVEFDYEKEIYEIYVGEGETFGFDFYADGYLPKHITVVSDESENIGEIRVVDVPLERAGALLGTVVDALSGSPVDNARIQIYGRGSLNKMPIRPLSKARATVTSEDGSFRVDGLAGGRFFFKVTAPGYAMALVDSCELELNVGTGSNLVKLWPGGTLSGSVLDVLGNPFEDATVQVIPPGTEEVITSKTNPDGTYIMSGLPAGELEILVEDFYERLTRGSWMKLRKVVTMAPGGSRTADFSFAGSCTIQGTCFYDGEPGWGVVLKIINSTGKTISIAHSSDNGFYRIFGIPAGSYVLEATATLSGTGGFFRQTLGLSDGEDLMLDINLAHKAVHGLVKGPDGIPIHGAIVELLSCSFKRSHSTFADQTGNFIILSVKEGTYYITARADKCAEVVMGPWPLGGGHPVRRTDFNLEAGGIGRIVVVDQEKEPIPGAIVHLSADFLKDSHRKGVTRYSGVCVFENLNQDVLNVLAGAEGFAPKGARLNAVPGERTSCYIELARGGNIRLEVRTRDGIPVSDAIVTISRFSLFGLAVYDLAKLGFLSASDPRFMTDGSGTFTLGPFPSGSISLQVRKGSLYYSTEISIISGEVNTVRVTLE